MKRITGYIVRNDDVLAIEFDERKDGSLVVVNEDDVWWFGYRKIVYRERHPYTILKIYDSEQEALVCAIEHIKRYIRKHEQQIEDKRKRLAHLEAALDD